ncbi:unnamed protein product, partial [Adineta ricciae]
SLGKTILEAELDICHYIQFDYIVLWNSSAEICKDIKCAMPTNGSSPSSIFENTNTKEAFNQSDVIVFVTDGEIGNASVAQVSTNYSKLSTINMSEVRCLLFHPSAIDISVLAPLMIDSNVLCLFYDGKTFYVLSSVGYISNIYKSPDNFTDYASPTTVDLDELFHHIQIYGYANIPHGCIKIHENEQEIVAFNFDEFISVKDVYFSMKIDEEEWKTLIQYGKISNKLSELRYSVTQMKLEAIRLDMHKIKSDHDFKYTKQRDEIIENILLLQSTEQSETEDELARLRQQL